MEIVLRKKKDKTAFISHTSDGRALSLGASIDPDTQADGQSPMQAVLSAVAGCSSIDVVEILQKMRQPLEHLVVEAKGKRRDEIPRVFTSITLHYKLYGDLKEKKVEEALELSVHKYCSVSEMLKGSVDVSYTYEIIRS